MMYNYRTPAKTRITVRRTDGLHGDVTAAVQDSAGLPVWDAAGGVLRTLGPTQSPTQAPAQGTETAGSASTTEQEVVTSMPSNDINIPLETPEPTQSMPEPGLMTAPGQDHNTQPDLIFGLPKNAVIIGGVALAAVLLLR
jgi:hypothetical protein